MKTIEQKAKAYDKALEIAKPYYEEAIKSEKTASVEFLESMFDELRNNDEEIKENKVMKEIKEEDKDFILKIARHFSGLYKERTNAILHLADVIQGKEFSISRDYTHDKTYNVDW